VQLDAIAFTFSLGSNTVFATWYTLIASNLSA
jgi:hypothetical protein